MKTILAILFFAAQASAGVPFWQAPQASTTSAAGTGYLSGTLKVYPSTTTAAAAPGIMLDGVNRQLTVRNGVNVTTMSATGFAGNLTGAASLNVLKAGDTMTGPLAVTSATVTGNAFSIGNSTFTCIYGKCGIGTAAPAYALDFGANLGARFLGGSILFQDNPANYSTVLQATSGGMRFYTNAAKAMSIGTNSGEQLYIASGGNVGVGTTAPATALHVQGGVVLSSTTAQTTTLYAFEAAASNGSAGIKFSPGSQTADRRSWGLKAASEVSGDLALYVSASNNNTPSVNVMEFTKEGRVGIGATAPESELEVKDPTGTSQITINSYGGGSSGLIFKRQNVQKWNLNMVDGGDFGFYRTDQGYAMYLLATNGNVGIGDTAPTAKLVVNGNIVSSGTVQGSTITAGTVQGSTITALGNMAAARVIVSSYTQTPELCLGGECKTGWGTVTGIDQATLLNSTWTFTGILSGAGLHSPGDFKWKISQSSACGSGWLRANGSSISTTTYSGLFAEVGYIFGGSGANFSLPGMNDGEFIRAVSTGTAGGYSAGMGAKQLDELAAHTHLSKWFPGGSTGYASGASYTTNSANDSPTSSTGGAETRPRNYALIPCIYTGVK